MVPWDLPFFYLFILYLNFLPFFFFFFIFIYFYYYSLCCMALEHRVDDTLIGFDSCTAYQVHLVWASFWPDGIAIFVVRYNTI